MGIARSSTSMGSRFRVFLPAARPPAAAGSIFRIRNLSMNGQEAVLFPVSLSLSISPQEADAGTALTLNAVAECPEQYDLSGDPVLFLDATGHEVGRAPLAAREGNDFGAEITVTAPIELGEYGYSIVLMPT